METSAFVQNDAVNGEIPVHPVKGQKDSVQIPVADEWPAGKTMPAGRMKVQKARLLVVILAGIIRQEAGGDGYRPFRCGCMDGDGMRFCGQAGEFQFGTGAVNLNGPVRKQCGSLC